MRAVDGAGNADKEPEEYLWTIDEEDNPNEDATRSLSGYPSDWQAPSQESQPESDAGNEKNIMDRMKSNWLIASLLLVCILIALFFACVGCYYCIRNFIQKSDDHNQDGGGSQLTYLESEVLSAGVMDLNDFDALAASLPESLKRFR